MLDLRCRPAKDKDLCLGFHLFDLLLLYCSRDKKVICLNIYNIYHAFLIDEPKKEVLILLLLYFFSFNRRRSMEAQSSGTEVRRLHIVYFLSRKGRIEHPHLIRLHHFSRNGVRLRGLILFISAAFYISSFDNIVVLNK